MIMKFQKVGGIPMIYINKDALITIENEIKKEPEKETGGILLGYYFKNTDLFITHAIYSGPKSIKRTDLFVKDLEYSKKIQYKYFEKYGMDYIGEWHKHPANNTNYSPLDYFSMFKTAFLNKKQIYFIIAGKDFNSNFADSYLSVYSYLKTSLRVKSNIYKVIDKPEEFMESNIACFLQK